MRDDELIQRLSFFGRPADEISREVIPFKHFKVSIKDVKKEPHYKQDGYFAFSDIKESVSDCEFHYTANHYQSRKIKKDLPPAFLGELKYDGEDELYIVIANEEDVEINGETKKKVFFDSIPFVKTIPRGARVYGENGLSTTLAQPLEGERVGFAIIEEYSPNVGQDKILRIVRSNNIIMRPGPYYPFEGNTTLLALKFSDDSMPLGELPVADVKCEIKEVNQEPVETTQVVSLDIKTVTIDGKKLILGTEKDITTYSNARGNVVFYYPADTDIDELGIKVSTEGYEDITVPITLPLVKRQRNFIPIELTKI